MGLPTLNINFVAAAQQTAYRIMRGSVAVIVKEATSALQGKPHKITSSAEIPTALTADNKTYINSIFVGNQYAPREVLIATVAKTNTDYAVAFDLLATEKFDWLVAPPDVDEAGCRAIATWIYTMREDGGIAKAILPNFDAGREDIVNFASAGIKQQLVVPANSNTSAGVTAGWYCGRVAGYIAGTPLAQSITYGVLPEVTDCTRISKAEMERAIDAGQLILMHDGEKVKFASGVTSLVQISGGKFAGMKKIKIMAVLDRIRSELRLLVQDNYIGKMPNSYDNKCLLMTAIKSYFRQLELEGILEEGSTVSLDLDAHRRYLTERGVDIADMTDDDIKRANTGSYVFINASVSVLDAIENIEININLDVG
ncbi:MAG: phage tail sheath protein [Clostridia bacterium]|nr:phage tail sheath protein [Clostridia bacterium]